MGVIEFVGVIEGVTDGVGVIDGVIDAVGVTEGTAKYTKNVSVAICLRGCLVSSFIKRHKN